MVDMNGKVLYLQSWNDAESREMEYFWRGEFSGSFGERSWDIREGQRMLEYSQKRI